MRILITAGPTREYLDSVRFISNAASGRMGFAIAEQAMGRGHDIVLVLGPVRDAPPDGAQVIHVVSAVDMLDACLTQFDRCDVAVMSAAVGDWTPRRRAEHKLAKADLLGLDLVATPDICAALGRSKGDRIVIGFAVQDESPHALAEQKMARKHCDAMVLNSPGAIGADQSSIEIKSGDGPWSGPAFGDKRQLAVHIVDLIERLAESRSAR